MKRVDMEQALIALAAHIGMPANNSTRGLVIDGANVGLTRTPYRVELAEGQTPFGMTRFSASELCRMIWFAVSAFDVKKRHMQRLRVDEVKWMTIDTPPAGIKRLGHGEEDPKTGMWVELYVAATGRLYHKEKPNVNSNYGIWYEMLIFTEPL